MIGLKQGVSLLWLTFKTSFCQSWGWF